MKPSFAMMIARTHPDDRPLVEQTIDKAFRDGAGFEFEHRLSMPDGTVRFVQLVTRAEERGRRRQLHRRRDGYHRRQASGGRAATCSFRSCPRLASDNDGPVGGVDRP